MLAIVDEFTGRGVIERACASAQPGPALEDRDPQAAIDQGRRRREARQAATDDHDMRREGFGRGIVGSVIFLIKDSRADQSAVELAFAS